MSVEAGKQLVELVAEVVPELTEIQCECPAYGMPLIGRFVPKWFCTTWGGSLISIIMHLNDEHQWSREDIATWLDYNDWDLEVPVPENERNTI